MSRYLQLAGAYFLLLFCLHIPAQGQRTDTLRAEEYLQQVMELNPLAVAARLLNEQARLEVRSARGFFDPVLGGSWNEKQFDDKTYYRLFSGDVKVATRLGVGLKAGYDYAQGAYLNPESTVPDNGLWYAGIEVPLLQGLLFDEGRALLRQAKIRQQRLQWEQQQAMADLLYDATQAYWQWAGEYQQVVLLQSAITVADTRYRLVRGGYLVDELPAIDTLEAYLQLNTLRSELLSQQQALLKAEQLAAAYLWSKEEEPLWQEGVVPVPLPPPTLPDSLQDKPDFMAEQLAEATPQIQSALLKLEELETERRWKAEKLKPKLVASYNLLSGSALTEGPTSYSPNNYKAGVSFKMPLLLRKERGELQLNKLKMQSTNLALRQKRLELTNKLSATWQNLQLLQEQIQLNKQLASGYRALWLGEQQKFDFGESTLFYVNTRELKYLESQLKLLELQTKFQLQEAELRRLLGVAPLQ